MTNPAHTLLKHPLLTTLGGMLPAFPATGQLCLVGGAVRDAQLGRPVSDFDFTSPGDPTPLAQALAGQLAGHWFWLDAPRRQSRGRRSRGASRRKKAARALAGRR